MTQAADVQDGPGERKGPGFTIVRGREGVPHGGRKPRAAADPDFVPHPAIERGMRLVRETSDAGGAVVRTLLDAPGIHVSYAWFKSGFPLPLHSHDVDCFYQLIAGSMRVGTEDLGQGDGVFIPAGVPYTVVPGDRGVEFLEIRTSHDYDTTYRARTDAYWDRIAQTRRDRKEIWRDEPPPYGLIPVFAAATPRRSGEDT